MYENNSNVRIENCAITSDDQPITIFRIDENVINPNFPDWLHGQGSYSRNNVINAIKDHYPEGHDRNLLINSIVAEQVNCMKFDDLLTKHCIDHIDLLNIDTQGYDYSILNSIDFTKFKPNIIMFETEFPEGRTACIKRLEKFGYVIVGANAHDTVMLADGVSPD